MDKSELKYNRKNISGGESAPGREFVTKLETHKSYEKIVPKSNLELINLVLKDLKISSDSVKKSYEFYLKRYWKSEDKYEPNSKAIRTTWPQIQLH